jgi:hypothetical protein
MGMESMGHLVVRLCCVALAAVASLAALPLHVLAQDAPPVAAAAHGVPSIDVGKLPIDMQRVRRRLAASSTTEERDGLNLRYVVTVFGESPRIKLFTPADNLAFGQAPYGAPSHGDLMRMITPIEYRAPAANFGAAFRWFADKARDR